MRKELINKSRKISYLLRHNPEDLKMNKQGWVLIDDLLDKMDMSMSELEEIIDTNDKKRFGMDFHKLRIKAFQGHNANLNVKADLKEVKFPGTYYHGTNFESVNLIEKHGLKPMTRTHVHLSKDIDTAVNVGNRHVKRGSTVMVLIVDGNQMKKDGLKIYESDNGVILADSVPKKYITRL